MLEEKLKLVLEGGDITECGMPTPAGGQVKIVKK